MKKLNLGQIEGRLSKIKRGCIRNCMKCNSGMSNNISCIKEIVYGKI